MQNTADQTTAPAEHASPEIYNTRHKVRFVTAASLFDGHDASINIMRRILQASGAEVIHLGHNRSVRELVDCAIQEDAQGIALSSYQGGHMEYFKYLKDLLAERGAGHIKIFGGGGGVITGDEIRELEAYGIGKIFSPEDGRVLGLQGIINHMMRETDFDTCPSLNGDLEKLNRDDHVRIARVLSFLENHAGADPNGGAGKALDMLKLPANSPPVLGITGPGGAGKSSLTDELVLRMLENNPELHVALIAVDPTRRKTGGALLGDRIRLNALSLFPERAFMRSFATRTSHRSVSDSLADAVKVFKAAGFDLIIVETSGIGQSDSEITELADMTMYVMTAEYGAPTQLEKISMLDYADLVALNKAEKSGSRDALQYVKKQYQRNHDLFTTPVEEMPVHAVIAGRFNDPGVNDLYNDLAARLETVESAGGGDASGIKLNRIEGSSRRAGDESDFAVIPGSRVRYLSEIAETIRSYHEQGDSQKDLVRELEALETTKEIASKRLGESGANTAASLEPEIEKLRKAADPALLEWLEEWPRLKARYSADEFVYKVRDRELRQKLHYRTLSGLPVPSVALPNFDSKAELTRYYYRENLPGVFPFTAGVFPFRKADEDPTRMFAGEGGPERTNVRFHYLSQGGAAARLSTAFDSVTLYGENPDTRPDIYGKIGNSGVSIPTLDDCKRLYSGFDLCLPSTSVSMTINGPAPMLLAFFFNTAIDQQVERRLRETGRLDEARAKIKAHYEGLGLEVPVYKRDLPEGHDGNGLELLGLPGSELLPADEYEEIKNMVLTTVRGTVQADILKEDQAQNTCIFSTQFAIRMMGDIQKFFTEKGVRNFYSVSISGYHIAEAGANPITQTAFTLANGFTFLEYYLSRGLKVDEFAPNLSFFFSNGIDAEYSVIGRVARRIWAVALKKKYGANERSQKLKYHIQTSGRSLHAREIDFNDIRTTLQALYALYDNCNSLHTNAFDEAVTTPTEESVRRAMAIQLIINRELGLNKNHNPIQGAYIIEELTDLVEEAVLSEFDRLTERGGVPGAMETMYQRGKIQEESLHYERLKHSGELPIIGVNTWLRESTAAVDEVSELIRSSDDEKDEQIAELNKFDRAFPVRGKEALERLKQTVLSGGNIFAELMETVKYCSLGRISEALYSLGGSYRRNM